MLIQLRVELTIRNKVQWNLYHTTESVFQEKVFENVVGIISDILPISGGTMEKLSDSFKKNIILIHVLMISIRKVCVRLLQHTMHQI